MLISIAYRAFSCLPRGYVTLAEVRATGQAARRWSAATQHRARGTRRAPLSTAPNEGEGRCPDCGSVRCRGTDLPVRLPRAPDFGGSLTGERLLMVVESHHRSAFDGPSTADHVRVHTRAADRWFHSPYLAVLADEGWGDADKAREPVRSNLESA